MRRVTIDGQWGSVVRFLESGRRVVLALMAVWATGSDVGTAQDSSAEPAMRTYDNRLKLIRDPVPLLADHPEFVAPVQETRRYHAAALVNDDNGTLHVRAWRFSYNARGIIEMPGRLDPAATAVIMVHPWGIDDGQGWQTPEPAGVCDFCTPEKNHLAARHTRKVINPFLKRMRPHVRFVMYSLPGGEDPIRRLMYRSIRGAPTDQDRVAGAAQLKQKLQSFDYRGQPLPTTLSVSADRPVIDYFRQFPGLDAGAAYNNEGFWQLPIPVTRDIDVDPQDIVIYDAEGYPPLRDFLTGQGIRHVLLTGYAADMCYCRTTAGYENLSQDFNVFLVGDATLATFPANSSPQHATNAAVSFASLKNLITQVSWVSIESPSPEKETRP
ncbi:MAG: hypothetical protein RIK87_13815 [Fuerstiella sp.]